MLSHPKHALKPRETSCTRHFVWPHSTMRTKKMQNYQAHNDSIYRSPSDYGSYKNCSSCHNKFWQSFSESKQDYCPDCRNNPQSTSKEPSVLHMLIFIISFCTVAVFCLKYAIESHMISALWLGFSSLFCDIVKIKLRCDFFSEIAFLSVFGFMTYGIYSLFRYRLAYAITFSVIIAAAIFYYANQPEQGLTTLDGKMAVDFEGGK